MLFEDGTISLTPKNNPTLGNAIKAISIEGLQEEIKIIDQILDGLASTPGILSDTDMIIEAMGKIKASLPTAYTAATTATGVAMTAFQRVMRVTATGQTITLPPFNDPGVILVPYLVIFPPDAASAGTIAVVSGNLLNDVVDGTYAAPISAIDPGRVWAISDGTGWWIC